MKHKMWLILPPLLVVLGSPAYGQLTRSEESQEVSPQGNCQGNSDCLTSEEYLIETGNGIWLPPSLGGGGFAGLEYNARPFNMAGTIPVGVPVVSPGADETPANTPPTQYILTGGVDSETSTSPPNEDNGSTLVLLQEAALGRGESNEYLLEPALGQYTGSTRVDGNTTSGEVNEVSQGISTQAALLESTDKCKQQGFTRGPALDANTGKRGSLIATVASQPSIKPLKKPHPVIRKIRTVCTFMQPIVSVAVGVLTILLLLL